MDRKASSRQQHLTVVLEVVVQVLSGITCISGRANLKDVSLDSPGSVVEGVSTDEVELKGTSSSAHISRQRVPAASAVPLKCSLRLLWSRAEEDEEDATDGRIGCMLSVKRPSVPSRTDMRRRTISSIGRVNDMLKTIR